MQAADMVYVIQKHDTLTEIAQHHGLSVHELARYNGLDDPDRIFVGQRIKIPHQYVLSSSLRRKLDRIHVTPHKWKYIVIHHSGATSGTVAGMDRYHREERHMENGLAYHFVIGNGHGMKDGEIAIGNRWLHQIDGGHLASYSLNKISIGICLVGNFDRTRPTSKQLSQLHALVAYLMRRCHLKADAVTIHQDINPIYTRCPGKHFPTTRFMSSLK